MARLTSEQLQEAKRRRAKERAQAEEQEREMREEKKRRGAQRDAWLRESRERHRQLVTVVDALYDEVDKLTRKWPSLPVSQRTLERTNKTIRAVRDLLAEESDEFIRDVHEFVAAGDMPENRDVSMALRELRAGLERLKLRYWQEWQMLTA